MPKVLNRRHGLRLFGQSRVYVGRPTKWGNPYSIGPDGSREEVIEKFKAYLLTRPDLLSAIIPELEGKDLVCWCAPLPCHADVLLELANA